MNNYEEGRRFLRLLEMADTGDVNMSDEDWCEACGYLSDHGHGYAFTMPENDEEVIAAIEEVARTIAEGVE